MLLIFFLLYLTGFIFFALLALTKMRRGDIASSVIARAEGSRQPSHCLDCFVPRKDGGPLKRRFITATAVFFAVFIISFNFIFAIIALIGYAYFTWSFADRKKKKRSALIDRQTAQVLTVMRNYILSGKTLNEAISLSAKETDEPLKRELTQISDKLAVGGDFDEILSDISSSAPSPEFQTMADALRISKDSGAKLGDVFEKLAESCNERIALQAKVKALTAQGRLSGNIISAIPFIVAAMMTAIEPDMMSPLWTDFAGNVLLLTVVVMVAAGSFVIRKMTEI